MKCWECGAETSRPMRAVLRLPSGLLRSFELCAACYRDTYLPLIAEMAGGPEPLPLPTPSRARPRARRGPSRERPDHR